MLIDQIGTGTPPGPADNTSTLPTVVLLTDQKSRRDCLLQWKAISWSLLAQVSMAIHRSNLSHLLISQGGTVWRLPKRSWTSIQRPL
jgi:hypothetical protein